MAIIWGRCVLKQTEKLERVQMRATKIIKELVNKTSEKRLREQGLLGLEERGLEGKHYCLQICKGLVWRGHRPIILIREQGQKKK